MYKTASNWLKPVCTCFYFWRTHQHAAFVAKTKQKLEGKKEQQRNGGDDKKKRQRPFWGFPNVEIVHSVHSSTTHYNIRGRKAGRQRTGWYKIKPWGASYAVHRVATIISSKRVDLNSIRISIALRRTAQCTLVAACSSSYLQSIDH